MSNKVWWKSKTLWVNAIVATLVAAEAATGSIQPYINVNLYVAIAVLLPIVNAILRVVTTDALFVRKYV